MKNRILGEHTLGEVRATGQPSAPRAHPSLTPAVEQTGCPIDRGTTTSITRSEQDTLRHLERQFSTRSVFVVELVQYKLETYRQIHFNGPNSNSLIAILICPTINFVPSGR